MSASAAGPPTKKARTGNANTSSARVRRVGRDHNVSGNDVGHHGDGDHVNHDQDAQEAAADVHAYASAGVGAVEEDDEAHVDNDGGNSCVLCTMLMRPACFGVEPTSTERLRRVMCTEQRNYGCFPDKLVYNAVYMAYENLVVRPAQNADLSVQPPKLTRASIKNHFENHIQMLPRRTLVRLAKRMSFVGETLYHHHLFNQSDNAPLGAGGVDLKTLATYNACVAKELDILKIYGEICKKDVSVSVDGDELGDVGDNNDTMPAAADAATSDAALMMM